MSTNIPLIRAKCDHMGCMRPWCYRIIEPQRPVLLICKEHYLAWQTTQQQRRAN